MASNLYKQFLYSFNPMLTFLEGSFKIGASGAIAATTGTVPGSSGTIGTGITGVTKNGTGQYQIQLKDNYNRFLDLQAVVISPTSAAGATTDGSFIVGKPYQIIFPSTSTNWQTVGLGTGLSAAYGMAFVATSGASNGPSGSSGATAAGNGTVASIGVSAISSIEVLPNPNLEMGPLPNQGGFIQFQTLDKNNAPVAPTSGTVIRFNLSLRNSSLLGTNETASNY